MSNNIEITQIKDLPTDLLDEIQERIKPYIIGLLGVNIGTSGEEPQLLGSGTLIQIQDKYCIVTAQHLTDKLKKYQKLGLILGSFVHRFVVDTSFLQIVEIGTPVGNSIGPDLAVIILPIIDAGTIKAKNLVFWNIINHSQTVLSKSIAKDSNIRLWIVCGFPEEWSKDGDPVGGFAKTLICCCLCGFTGAEEYWAGGEFDYLKLSVLYKNRADLPMTFRGLSGGGIWKAELFRSNNGKISCTDDLLFLGVAFRETAIQDDLRSIIGHGWRSIYEIVPKLIK